MKTAVITGSTRGLGFEMAKRFHAAGWNLVLNGVNPQRLEQAVETLRSLPGAGAILKAEDKNEQQMSLLDE